MHDYLVGGGGGLLGHGWSVLQLMIKFHYKNDYDFAFEAFIVGLSDKSYSGDY